MRNRLSGFVAALTLLSASAVAQVVETIEVRVANIDVVVTDRAGQPVHGLTREDFELYENGKLQPITNFSEIRAESTPQQQAATTSVDTTNVVTHAPRTLIVFIDNSSIDPIRRNQVIDSVNKTLDKLLRPGDEAMVATWNQHFETVEPFTSDHAAIKRALDKVRTYAASASSLTAQKEQVLTEARGYVPTRQYNLAVSAARAYAEWVRHTQIQLTRSLTQTISMLSGVEGKRLLIFVGGELEGQPGLDVFQQVDTMFAGFNRRPMPAVVRETELNINDELLKVARAANAHGVTLYMLDALDRSVTDAASPSRRDFEAEFTNQTNSYFSMVRLAWNTGGTVLSGSTNFEGALVNISRDLDSYYSIGYKPAEKGTTDRTINVKVKRAGLSVRTRRTYTLRTADEQTADHVIANAFHTSMSGDFPVQIAAERPEPFQQGLYKVKLTLTFPSTLTYLPDGQNMAAEYTVYFVTTMRDGSMSPVGKQTQPVKIPAAAMQAVTQKPFTHSTALVVKRGEQTISVAVFDRYGARTGYARAVINAR